MKKIYEKPTVEVVDVELESLLAASPNYQEPDGAPADPTTPDPTPGEPGYSKEHNGFWE